MQAMSRYQDARPALLTWAITLAFLAGILPAPSVGAGGIGSVVDLQKISAVEGGFVGPLEEGDGFG